MWASCLARRQHLACRADRFVRRLVPGNPVAMVLMGLGILRFIPDHAGKDLDSNAV